MKISNIIGTIALLIIFAGAIFIFFKSLVLGVIIFFSGIVVLKLYDVADRYERQKEIKKIKELRKHVRKS